MIRLVKEAEYLRMPWRNGHGETAQVAIAPADATLNDFDWRVSMARMDAAAPFSIFPDTDRTLSVLRGDGLRVSVAGGPYVQLTRESEPLTFRGDETADATLPGGAVTDLNVMTRRSKLRHSVRRIPVAGDISLALHASLAMLVCAHGIVGAESNGDAASLEALDTLLMDGPAGTLRVSSAANALVYLIEIESVEQDR